MTNMPESFLIYNNKEISQKFAVILRSILTETEIISIRMISFSFNNFHFVIFYVLRVIWNLAVLQNRSDGKEESLNNNKVI